MKIYVPGNLLLLGEYVVTEPGGRGIALAIDTWGIIEAEEAVDTSIQTNFQGTQQIWTEKSNHVKPPLIECILNRFPKTIPLKLTIDTSAFSYSDGRKKGYGSSAVVTVGLTYLLLQYSLNRIPDKLKEVFPLALSIHREFQGGRGSGYDVAASLFGGVGLFTGGELPKWQPIQASWAHAVYLARGDEASSTKDALKSFIKYKTNHAEEIAEYISKANEITLQMSLSPTFEKAKTLFDQAAILNQWMHDKINIASEGPVLKKILETYRKLGFPGKALGAGGEIGALLVGDAKVDAEYPNLEILKVANQGLNQTYKYEI